MAKCDTCGNDYGKAFQVTMGDRKFDCFECAIQAMAPECSACGCRIIGHGPEANGDFFCCDHCAEERGSRASRIGSDGMGNDRNHVGRFGSNSAIALARGHFSF